MTGVFWTGFASGLSLIVAIGSQNAFLLRQGLLRQHVLALVLFCSLSDAILILAGVAGAGALVADKPEWLMVSRYAGALFLAVYALFAARRVFRPAPLLASSAEAPTLLKALLLCFGLEFGVGLSALLVGGAGEACLRGNKSHFSYLLFHTNLSILILSTNKV